MKSLLKNFRQKEKGFTLIELLVVIAIILVLASILLFAINPAELLKKARDSQRISDLGTVATTLNLYLSDVTPSKFGDASATTAYFSYISASATCSTHTFLDVYHTTVDTTKACKSSVSNAAKTDNTGWIPVNLGNISTGSPLGAFPVDPIQASSCATADTTTAGTCDTYFYRMTFGNAALTKYVIDAVMESSANNSKCTSDGGIFSGSYEVGNSFTPDGGTSANYTARDNGCAT